MLFSAQTRQVTDERNPQDPARELARQFHEIYERLAPSFGYKTRPASAVPWEQCPALLQDLMTATCAEILATASQLAGAVPQEELRELLYRCIKELDYVQSAEHISQCASAEGKELIDLGMKLLSVQDLSLESLIERRGK